MFFSQIIASLGPPTQDSSSTSYKLRNKVYFAYISTKYECRIWYRGRRLSTLQGKAKKDLGRSRARNTNRIHVQTGFFFLRRLHIWPLCSPIWLTVKKVSFCQFWPDSSEIQFGNWGQQRTNRRHHKALIRSRNSVTLTILVFNWVLLAIYIFKISWLKI